MSVAVKICGVKTLDTISAAAQSGAHYIGLVFYPSSPRHVRLEQAQALLRQVPPNLLTVALCVDPEDTLLQELSRLERLDMLQLHGTETPRRIAALRAVWRKPVMKALPIARREDLTAATDYAPVVDQYLFDAKPHANSLPGGNGLAFDWQLLAGQNFKHPWMLAGGLTPENVSAAIKASGAKMVDVSSGVEDAPGHKSLTKIAAFCAAVKAA